MPSSDSNSDDGEEQRAIIFDEKLPGSIALLNGHQLPDFDFASFEGAMPNAPIKTLAEECFKAFTASTVVEGDDAELGVSSGETYWVAAASSESYPAPRCVLESLALEIFNFHTTRLGLVANEHYDPASSGAEWWTQCIEGDAEIGFHWDKDYTLEEEVLNVHVCN